MTMSLYICFMSQPLSRNSTASQSSSWGCEGRWPMMPKSSVVSTRPAPKSSFHMRLTVTRAVKGFSGLTVHSAERQAIVRLPAGKAGRKCGVLASTLSLRAV